MIPHWKCLDSEITGFEFQYDPTSSGEIIPPISYVFDLV